MRDWCRDKFWWTRLPLWLVMIYLFWNYSTIALYKSLLDNADFVLHEVGHVIFGLFGQFVGLLGGTILQLLFPILAIVNFRWLKKDYFAIAVSLFWLGTSLRDVSIYLADARSQSLPLVPLLGPDPLHDWHEILNRLGWLQYDYFIGKILNIMASGLMVIAIAWGADLIFWMYKMRKIKSSIVIYPELVIKNKQTFIRDHSKISTRDNGYSRL